MYIDGFVTPVPKENKEAYLQHLKEAKEIIKEFGVTRMVEAWGDNVPHGENTDFYRAVGAKENEAILFSWFEWPSKAARDAGMRKMMADERMQKMEMPFDGSRMLFGGFAPILDETFS